MLNVRRVVMAVLLLGACGVPPPSPLVTACRDINLCVDCTSTCQRMLQCQVAFDDPTPMPPWVEDTPLNKCERYCAQNDTISPAREQCILAVNPSDTARCQQEVLQCLGVSPDAGVTY